MTEQYRQDDEEVRSYDRSAEDPNQTEVVTTTDPVTGQVVNVNRTTGEVVSGPGVTQSIYRSTSTGQAALPAQSPAVREQQVRQTVADPYAARRNLLFRLEQLIYLVFGIIEALIGIRFILRLLAANPNAGFADFIYSVTAPFVAPFYSLFGVPGYRGSALELGDIVAIIVYALIAWLLVRLLWLAGGDTRRTTSTVTERIDRNM